MPASNAHIRDAIDAGAMLDRLADEALVEAMARPQPGEEAAEQILAETAAFLRAHPDRDALIKRLHAALADTAQTPSPSPDPPTEPPESNHA